MRLMGDCKAFFTFCRGRRHVSLPGMIGSGVLLQAKGFVNGGWAFSSGILFFSALVEVYCLHIVIAIRRRFRGSFSDIGGQAFGLWGRVVTDIFTVACQLNGLFAYSAFVSLHLQQAVAQWSGGDSTGGSLWIYGGAYFLVVAPLLWVRNLERLAFFHIFGNVMVVIVVGTIVVFSSLRMGDQHGISPEVEAFNSSKFSLYFGGSLL